MMTVSFVIPVYNCAAYLQSCVDSIRGAGIPEYEILLVDDGSTDGSGGFCDDLAREDSRIRVFHQKNSGVSAARNRGIREARGKYILFVDADDTLKPFDAVVLKYLEQNVDMVMFGMTFRYYHKDNFVKEDVLTVGQEKLYAQGQLADDFSALFHQNYLSPVWNKFIKRSVLTENGLLFDPRLTVYEDLVFSLCAIGKCQSIVVLPQYYYLYRNDYDRNKAVDRIGKIRDIMGNTDLIAKTFTDFEKSAATAGAKDTRQIWECLMDVYFMLFRTKMHTTKLEDIGRHCRDFRNDEYVGLCLKRISLESEGQKRWYHWIETESALAIWLYMRYLCLRHFVVRNIKRITGWRLH